MKASVLRWGKSLALKIPPECAEEVKISAGSRVELLLESGSLVIRPIVRKRHSLTELLKRVTRNNRHDGLESGQAMGNEVW